MTLFTSETKDKAAIDKNLKTSFNYLIISIILAAAGAIYEHFSFGVYSYFMIYAFAIPLIGGALPYMLRAMKQPGSAVTSDTEWLWHASIATLTTGSIVHGILAICGRPNSLTVIYLIAGAILLAAVIAMTIIKRQKRSAAI